MHDVAEPEDIFNIIATYGGSLNVLVCGLFISLWLLGGGDLGLHGVVGEMIMCTMFLVFTMRSGDFAMWCDPIHGI